MRNELLLQRYKKNEKQTTFLSLFFVQLSKRKRFAIYTKQIGNFNILKFHFISKKETFRISFKVYLNQKQDGSSCHTVNIKIFA